jgi:hypothetical protein
MEVRKMNENEIRSDYDNLVLAKYDFASASKRAAEQKRIVDLLEARAILDGSVVGKNAEERKASLLLMFPGDRAKLENYEEMEKAARLEMEVKQIEVDCLKMQMRLLELAKIGVEDGNV